MGDRVGLSIPCIPTGLYSVDYDVIGCGGIPRGRIIEVIGPESSGKTTWTLELIAAEQKNGICAFIDAEHSLDVNYASKLGVDIDNLVVSQPDSGEEALTTAEALVDSRAVTLIVVDSVAALVPRAELEGDMGDSHMGLQARLMSQAMRKLRGKCNHTGIPIVFTNQIREKIGVMFGSNETTPGGRALKFYASLRIDLRKVGQIKDGDVVIGQESKIRAIKNKVGTPFKESIVKLIYGVGYDKLEDIIDYGLKIGVIQKKGSWLKFDGKDVRRDYFIDHIIDLKDAIQNYRSDFNVVEE